MRHFIDAHHHLWAPQSDPQGLGYVWLKDIGAMKPFGDPTPIQRDYLLEEFLAEQQTAQMVGSVHVQCDPKLPDPVKETAFIQGISDRAGHPIMIVGFADLTDRNFAQVLRGHLAHPNLRGIRQIISHLPDRPEISFAPVNLLDDQTWRAQFAQLADHGLSFDLQLYPEQMPQAAEFLAGHPDIPVVIDHLGSPYDQTEAGLRTWEQGMAQLAQLPHISVKLGGSAMFIGNDLGPRFVYLVQAVMRLFGPKRVMFASNFPVDRLHLRYADLLATVRKTVDETAHSSVFRENASAFYRFPTAAC
jgi:predicted TIM-barrel fold metal-dependent hydrolase